MNTPIYTTNAIQDWESRWFADGNSSFGLMKQASLRLCLQIIDFIKMILPKLTSSYGVARVTIAGMVI